MRVFKNWRYRNGHDRRETRNEHDEVHNILSELKTGFDNLKSCHNTLDKKVDEQIRISRENSDSLRRLKDSIWPRIDDMEGDISKMDRELAVVKDRQERHIGGHD